MMSSSPPTGVKAPPGNGFGLMKMPINSSTADRQGHPLLTPFYHPPVTTVRCRRAANLWDKAIEALSDKDKEQISLYRSDRLALLNDVLETVELKKKQCMENRWKYKKSNGEDVILRDLFEKMTKWVKKFKEFGDIAVQYDPAHAALPWAGVRFLLQVSFLSRVLYESWDLPSSTRQQ